MKKIKTVYNLMAVLLIMPAALYAQENSDSLPAKPANQYVKSTFEYGVAINNQTVESLSKQSLDFIIQHRFGVIDNSTDLYGIYAPANIRLGLDYGITNHLTVGVGATKDKSLYDLQWKYVLLRQQKPGGMPVTITYYGDMARSALPVSNFENQNDVFNTSDRLSYFNELMIARKFNKRLSLQVGVTYTHYNLVDSVKDQIADHDFYGAAFVGRYKFSPQSSILVDCNLPFKTRNFMTTDVSGAATTESVPKLNLGIGFECSTGSHQFQVFVCNADQIINQEIAVYNMNSFSSKNILVGFNITREWGLK